MPRTTPRPLARTEDLPPESKTPTPEEQEILRRQERDLRKVTLQNELAAIKHEEELEAKAAKEARDKLLLEHIDVLLKLVPSHGPSSCSDQDPCNIHRCGRCSLLNIKENVSWQGWPAEADVTVGVSWPYQRD